MNDIEIKEKITKTYITPDGKEFNTFCEAEEWTNEEMYIEKISNILDNQIFKGLSSIYSNELSMIARNMLKYRDEFVEIFQGYKE